MVLGAFINYAILAPIMIQMGDIVPNAKGTIGFREITFWSLWCGVAMMTMASLLTFFAKPDLLISAFRNLLKRPRPSVRPSGEAGESRELPRWSQPNEEIAAKPQEPALEEAISETAPLILPVGSENDHSEQTRPRPLAFNAEAMSHIELPLSVSLVGIPLLGIVVAIMAHSFFGVPWWLSVVALFLVFGFCLIAINSTGLTSITPIGAMGKLTQLTFGLLAPGNREVNLMTAGITGEVASHSANLLQDIKPGYMLGAKPRQQAVGHVLGIFAGALLSVPIFYLVFLGLKEQTFDPNLSAEFAGRINAKEYPMPAATIWKAVADVLDAGHPQDPAARLRLPPWWGSCSAWVWNGCGWAPRTASRFRRSASASGS